MNGSQFSCRWLGSNVDAVVDCCLNPVMDYVVIERSSGVFRAGSCYRGRGAGGRQVVVETA